MEMLLQLPFRGRLLRGTEIGCVNRAVELVVELWCIRELAATAS